jgi:hypothetical protein
MNSHASVVGQAQRSPCFYSVQATEAHVSGRQDAVVTYMSQSVVYDGSTLIHTVM